jgi:hypothetical protein
LWRRLSGDVGAVPPCGVDVEGVEDAGLQRVAAGDDVDVSVAGVEGDGLDAGEFA